MVFHKHFNIYSHPFTTTPTTVAMACGMWIYRWLHALASVLLGMLGGAAQSPCVDNTVRLSSSAASSSIKWISQQRRGWSKSKWNQYHLQFHYVHNAHTSHPIPSHPLMVIGCKWLFAFQFLLLSNISAMAITYLFAFRTTNDTNREARGTPKRKREKKRIRKTIFVEITSGFGYIDQIEHLKDTDRREIERHRERAKTTDKRMNE